MKQEAMDAERQRLMGVLARAQGDELRALWEEAGLDASVHDVRRPETGLVTVRGRMGGGGAPFNLGEATVTRASVKLGSGEIGHAYALGRDADKARLSATIDALWQREETRERINSAILAPLAAREAGRDGTRRAETAATKVDFFTMVRGED